MLHSDEEIDRIIWEAIADSDVRSDFICYIIHNPNSAAHLDEAREKMMSASQQMAPAMKYLKAVMAIRDLAEKGDPCATFHMGKIYSLGIGVVRDVSQAVEWYEKAMELGEARAFGNLGWFYQAGTGVVKNPEKAFELLTQAGNDGVQSAKTASGTMLLQGEGCEKDVQEGIKRIEEAFEAGYLNAGNHLSDIYFEGKWVPKDIEKSHDWLEKVAEAGDEKSMAILGYRLVSGTHGKQDVADGLKWLQQAVDRKYHPAFLWFASLYRKGLGVPQDTGKMIALLQSGVEAGSPECAQALEQVLKERGAASNSPSTLQ
ncbi:MAG: sel1 repeat family protein [Oxalobacter sp.]|nr:sel1 repeat family protein [Oxalobacter sp.]